MMGLYYSCFVLDTLAPPFSFLDPPVVLARYCVYEVCGVRIYRSHNSLLTAKANCTTLTPKGRLIARLNVPQLNYARGIFTANRNSLHLSNKSHDMYYSGFSYQTFRAIIQVWRTHTRAHTHAHTHSHTHTHTHTRTIRTQAHTPHTHTCANI